MAHLLPVLCVLGPSEGRSLLLGQAVSLLCVSGPFHVLLPLACDQEAPCVPSGVTEPRGFRGPGCTARASFLLGLPFLPLGPCVGYLVAFWTVCTQQAATSPSLISRKPFGFGPGRGPERPQLSASYRKNPPEESPVPHGAGSSMKIYKSVTSCPGLCWAGS